MGTISLLSTFSPKYLINRLVQVYQSEVTVNCWFCNENNIIKSSEHHSWICPHCQQYNGFDEDGDYNCEQSEQYNVKDYKTRTFCTPENSVSKKNLLCQSCSQNQVMKVRQLAAFTPFHEKNYEQEVEMYREYLEMMYSLCSECESQVNEFLQQQDAMLMNQLDDTDHHKLAKFQKQKTDLELSKTKISSNKTCWTFISRLMLWNSALCSLLLSVLNLRLYVGSVICDPLAALNFHQLSMFLISYLPMDVAWDLRCGTAIAGVLLCLCGLYLVGKYSFYPGDVIHILLWLLTVIVLTLIEIHLLWNIYLNMVTFYFSILCSVRNRAPKNVTASSIQRKEVTRKPCSSADKTSEMADVSDDLVSSSSYSQHASASPDVEHETLSLQFECVRQNLESVSLGLGKRSVSNSSIWSLPAVITSVSPKSPPSDLVPDSSTDQKTQRRGVLAPSRLGFMTFVCHSSPNDSAELSCSSSSRSPINTSTTSNRSSTGENPQVLMRPVLDQPQSSVSDSLLGPCDSQGTNLKTKSHPHCIKGFLSSSGPAKVERHKADHWKDVSFVEPKVLRRSQRIATSGRPPKPWTLQKSQSCTNTYDVNTVEKIHHSFLPYISTNKTDLQNRNKNDAAYKLELQSSNKSNAAKDTPMVNKKSNDEMAKEQDSQSHSMPEFSDDENWAPSKKVSSNPYHQNKDLSWKYMFLGVIIGISVTTNVFLLFTL